MNIALLTEFKEWGGAETHTVQFARTLIERGHNATVVCLNDHTYELYRTRSGSQIPLALLRRSENMNLLGWARLFSKQPWDTCVLIKGNFQVGSWALDLAARYRFGNYVTIEHLTALSPPAKSNRRHFGIIPGLGLWWYRQRLLDCSRSLGPKKVICVSEAVRKRLIEDYRFKAARVVTVLNGVDVRRFRAEPAFSDIWRRRWGIPAGALVFGALGRFAPQKNYGSALSGFQALLKRFPDRDLRLVLVGEGPEEQTLRGIASRIEPRGRIVFSPFCDSPWEPLSAFDVFVMPSLNEGLPLVLLEAMACGRCSIATAVGGVSEVLSRPELGWLVPAGNVDEFAAAMIDAASRAPEQRAAIGALAREHVVTSFNSGVQHNALVDVVESLVQAPRLPARATGAV